MYTITHSRDTPRHHVACHAPACLLTCQRMAEDPQGFPKVAIQGLPAPLGDQHDGVLAMPPRMRQAVKGVRHGVLLRCALIRPPEEHSPPGSLHALPVSLVKSVLPSRREFSTSEGDTQHWCSCRIRPKQDS